MVKTHYKIPANITITTMYKPSSDVALGRVCEFVTWLVKR